MTITSPAFAEGQKIPARFTCDGEDRSPPLDWSGVPKEAATLVLINDDPDAPGGTWVHWVCYDLPASLSGLPEGLPPAERPAVGGTQGTNDFRKTGYGGPCPPGGTHRYYFKLYALDARLGLKPQATKREVVKAMQGHIVAEAELMGKYSR